MQHSTLSHKKIAFTKGNDIEFHSYETILYAKAEGNYSQVHLANGRVLTSAKKLGELEDLLPHDMFMRVHHSYIINLSHVERLNSEQQKTIYLAGGTDIPVSRRRKTDFLGKFLKL